MASKKRETVKKAKASKKKPKAAKQTIAGIGHNSGEAPHGREGMTAKGRQGLVRELYNKLAKIAERKKDFAKAIAKERAKIVEQIKTDLGYDMDHFEVNAKALTLEGDQLQSFLKTSKEMWTAFNRGDMLDWIDVAQRVAEKKIDADLAAAEGNPTKEGAEAPTPADGKSGDDAPAEE